MAVPSRRIEEAAWAQRQAHLVPAEAPPVHYYACNLLAVVAGVRERYDDLLLPAERHFGECVAGLAAGPLRLLARLVGRKPLVREDQLIYAEVPDVAEALSELARVGLVERSPAAPASSLLGLFTVAELRECFAEVRGSGPGKAALVASIVASVPAAFWRWRLRRLGGWVRLAQGDVLALYRLLFFGHRGADLAAFVLRDLDLHRYEPVPWSLGQRQFRDRATLQRYLDLLELADAVATLGPSPASDICREHVDALLAALWQPEGHRLLERRRGQTLNRLGRSLERSGELDAALACYQRSSLAPARERRMRILGRLGDATGVEALRQEILEAPWTALEEDYARLAGPNARRRGGKARRPDLPQLELRLDLGNCRVEQAVLDHLTANGGTGWHLENHLPMAIFALAYWEWLFAPVPGAFVNAFQAGPADLAWPDFFAAREGICRDPLASVLKPQLRARIDAKAGVVNGLFDWRRCPPAVLRTIVNAVPEADLRALLRIVRQDLAARRAGFPDLIIVRGAGSYTFVEVKGPGDQLQIHQRLWIEALLAHGLPVQVARVRPCLVQA